MGPVSLKQQFDLYSLKLKESLVSPWFLAHSASPQLTRQPLDACGSWGTRARLWARARQESGTFWKPFLSLLVSGTLSCLHSLRPGLAVALALSSFLVPGYRLPLSWEKRLQSHLIRGFRVSSFGTYEAGKMWARGCCPRE